MAKKLGLKWESVRRLVDVQKLSHKSLPELAQVVQQHLHKETYTREEVAKELGMSVSLTKGWVYLRNQPNESRETFIATN